MRKITLLIAALITAIGATAQSTVDYRIVTSGANVTGVLSRTESANSEWKDKFTYSTTQANPAGLVLQVTNPTATDKRFNMKEAEGGVRIENGDGHSTYTLSVPAPFKIKSYSFDVKATNAGNVITATDGTTLTISGSKQKFSVNNIDSETAAFELTGENNKENICTDFVVKVYNTEVSALESGNIYTFKSGLKSGWLMAKSGTDFAYNSNKIGNNANPGNENVFCQWVYYSTEKGAYLYNLGVKKFMSSNSDNRNSIPLTATPTTAAVELKSSTLSGYPIIIGMEGHAVNHNTTSNTFPYGVLLWDEGWSDTKWSAEPGSCHKATYINAADPGLLSDIESLVSKFEDPVGTAKEEAAMIETFRGKVGYPIDSEIDAFMEAVNNATTADEIETAKNRLYASTNINLPLDNHYYSMTMVGKNGKEFYVNYDGSTFSLVERNAGTVLPITAKFFFELNEDNTYTITAHNGKYLRYFKNTPVGDTRDEFTKISFSKMAVGSSNCISATAEELFGMTMWYSLRAANDYGYVTIADNGTIDTSSLPYYRTASDNKTTTGFTSAMRIEADITPERYYRMQCAASNGYYLSSNMNEAGTRLLINGPDRIFRYTQGTLLSYAEGRFIDVIEASNAYDIRLASVGSEIRIPVTFNKNGVTAAGKEKYCIIIGKNNDYTTTGNTSGFRFLYGNSNSGNIDSGINSTYPGDAGYNWTVEEVTALPVNVTEAGYATLYAPVALEVPSGLKAYTITVNGRWATLNEIGSNIVPAKTGVIIAGEDGGTATPGAYSFAITTTDETVESILKGSVETIFVEEQGYVLATGDGGIGFYRASMNQNNNTAFQNNSHKAYLPASEVSGSNGVSFYGFRFGEGTTGVEEVETENDNEKVIFDLSGRRVSEITTPGIYIIGGRKVLVK